MTLADSGPVFNTCVEVNTTLNNANDTIYPTGVGTVSEFTVSGDVTCIDVACSTTVTNTATLSETGCDGNNLILGSPASASFNVSCSNVGGNQPPVFTSTPITAAQEGQLYRYEVKAVDPEGSFLVFMLNDAPEGMGIDAANGLISWEPRFADVGLADVEVQAYDNLLAYATQFFQIQVQPRANEAPIPDHGGPYEGLTNALIDFDASDSIDPEGYPISLYHWFFGDGTEGFGVQASHTYTTADVYTVTLTVVDDRGAAASVQTTCRILAPN